MKNTKNRLWKFITVFVVLGFVIFANTLIFVSATEDANIYVQKDTFVEKAKRLIYNQGKQNVEMTSAVEDVLVSDDGNYRFEILEDGTEY